MILIPKDINCWEFKVIISKFSFIWDHELTARVVFMLPRRRLTLKAFVIMDIVLVLAFLVKFTLFVLPFSEVEHQLFLSQVHGNFNHSILRFLSHLSLNFSSKLFFQLFLLLLQLLTFFLLLFIKFSLAPMVLLDITELHSILVKLP